MIFVDRTKVKAPDILTVAGEAGPREKARAIANFTAPRPHAKFNYRAYSEEDVRNALIELFNKKCCYCESVLLPVYFGDVEHFRPKAEITEAQAPTDPGYYWLASDWDNLLFSCKLCNSHKYHRVYGQQTTELLGKMNQFPLDNFNHVRDHNVGIATEEPHRLLIDPCKDNPEKFLDYGDEGNILSKKSLSGVKSPKGTVSIKVYALQRMDLVDERKKLRIAIEVQQQRVLEDALTLLEMIDTANQATVERLEARLKREMQVLKDFMDSKKPYSAMAKQMIYKFLIEQYDHIIAKVV